MAFSKLPDTVTLVLILGFIATQVMSRWWSLYSTIPGIAKIITSAQFYVKPSIHNVSNQMECPNLQLSRPIPHSSPQQPKQFNQLDLVHNLSIDFKNNIYK